MPDSVDRRKFLKGLLDLGLAGAALGLSSCGRPAPATPEAPTAAAPTAAPATAPRVPTAVPTATAAPTPTAGRLPQAATAAPTTIPATAAATAVPTAAAAPDLAVAHGPAADPAEITRRALAAIGGIERFVKPGADVIVKPNICVAYRTPEYAATTNPEVVGAIVAICMAAGAKRVRVMDFPFGGTPQEAYQQSGIAKAVTAAGGSMEVMSRVKYKNTPIPQGKSIKNWDIYQDVLGADVLINVPIPKTHGTSGLTLGMKNAMGVVSGNRGALHNNIHQRLADLATVIRPALIVVDAIRILTGNGPTGGNLDDVRKLDTVIASADPVAADAYACTLFGLDKPVGFVTAAAAMGLGEADLSKLRIEQISL